MVPFSWPNSKQWREYNLKISSEDIDRICPARIGRTNINNDVAVDTGCPGPVCGDIPL